MNYRRNGKEVEAVLSRRERQVLYLFCHGLDSVAVGRRIGVTPHTANTYLRNLCRDLGISRSDLPRWTMQNPGALLGEPVKIGLHPEGCQCGAWFCLAMLGVLESLPPMSRSGSVYLGFPVASLQVRIPSSL